MGEVDEITATLFDLDDEGWHGEQYGKAWEYVMRHATQRLRDSYLGMGLKLPEK